MCRYSTAVTNCRVISDAASAGAGRKVAEADRLAAVRGSIREGTAPGPGAAAHPPLRESYGTSATAGSTNWLL